MKIYFKINLHIINIVPILAYQITTTIMKYRFTFKLSTGETMFHDAKTLASAKKWVKQMGWVASDFRQLSKYPVI